MPRAAPIQQDFSAGELTPLIHGQVQSERYKKGLALCRNWITTLQGAIVRRPGTTFVREVKDSTKSVLLVGFELDQNTGIVMEFGNLYIRFFYQEAVVLSGGVPYEVVTTYTEAELSQLQFAQTGTVLFIVHPNHPIANLIYTALTSWTLGNVVIEDGPYLSNGYSDQNVNFVGEALTLSAVSGVGLDLTTDGTAIFNSARDVGRLVRFGPGGGSAIGVYKITSFVSATAVKVSSLLAAGSVGPTTFWQMGFWIPGNYPSCITIHQNRFWVSGAPKNPFRIDVTQLETTTNTDNKISFAHTQPDGSVVSYNGMLITIASNTLDSVLWLRSTYKGVLVGASSGEFIIDGGGTAAITPTTVAARRQSSYGSADIVPVTVGRAVLFMQRASRKLRELMYLFAVDGFEADDLTLEAEHITTSGIKQLVYQREPYPIVWCVRNDGILIGATYQRTTQGMQVAWHQHTIGGSVGVGGDHAVVESITCIPTSTTAPGGTGVQDELWLVVRRTINGSTKRYIEYMQPPFQLAHYELPNLAYFVDCGLSRSDGYSITAAAAANPLTVTLNSVAGLAIGDEVTIDGVYGMEELNGQLFQVLNIAGLVVRLGDLNGVAIDGSGYDLFASGPPGSTPGLLFEKVATIGGLTHLEGQTVAMLGDGAPQTGVVAAASVALSPTAGFLSVGLPFTSDAQLLRFEAGGADGTSMGKNRRNNRLGLMVYQAGNVKVGNDEFSQEALVPRPANIPAALGQPLSTGVFSIQPRSDFNFNNQVLITVDTPLPATILAVMPMMETQDRT